MKAELVMIEGEDLNRRILIPPNGKIVIGRNHTCDLILMDTNVSRFHCLVIFSEKGSCIVDLGSASGTYINDRRVQKSALTFGDEMRLGINIFKFVRKEGGTTALAQQPRGEKTEESSETPLVCKKCGNAMTKRELPMSILVGSASSTSVLCKKCREISGHKCSRCETFVSEEDIALGTGVYLKDRYFCENHLPLDQNAPAHIAQYKLLMPLGGGAVSNVYKARHLYLNTIIALKLMHSKLSKQKNIIERFFREAQFGIRFDHPNIVRIYDAGKSEKHYYLVMDYFPGKTLYEKALKEPFPVSRVIQIARQLCDAVAYAHSWGVVHRDIKPSNVLINDNGDIKLTDLGAAKEWENPKSSDLTQRGQFIGTLRYQPPEQISDARAVDQRADIYAIGCSLYYCLTSKPPFTARVLAELLDKVLGGHYVPIDKMVPDIPKPLSELITQCLQRDVEKRPQTMAEVQTYLDKL